MTIPIGQLVIPTTLDTPHTDVNCLYPAKALGGSPIQSPNVQIERQQVEFYTPATPPDNVDGQPLVGVTACDPGQRVLIGRTNTNVFINGQLPIVTGDTCKMLLTQIERPLVGPFGPSSVIIGSRNT